MKTLKTLRTYLAAMLLLCSVAQAQLGSLANLAKKATDVTKGKKSVPAKDVKPADVKKTVPVKPVKETQPVKPETPPVIKKPPVEQRSDGTKITRRPDGKLQELHLANRTGGPMDIHHGLAGGRRVEVVRADHSRIVADGAHRGFVERPYTFRNHEFAHRTYYVNGHAYDRFYGRYGYRGAALEIYAPARYYPLSFYGWAYNTQWAAMPYAWGWAGNAWFTYYGAYFTPYPAYANASFWLTDYLISQSLVGAYHAQVEAQIALSQLPQEQGVLTPEIKQAIANEVQSQVALEYAQAQSNSQNADFDARSGSIERPLSDSSPHVFVAGSDVDLVDTTGHQCAVTEGDVLQSNPDIPLSADAATLVVLASKGGLECGRGVSVAVPLAALQEMQNHMRETLDQGLAALQTRQGSLPAPPQSASAPATPANFENGAPGPDPAVAAQISQQYQDAEKAEQDALNPGAGSAAIPAAASRPQEVTLGMSIDQVVSIQGQPNMAADKGSEKIYVYNGLKIIFTDGKVSDMN